jgi:hypothetical protein
MQLDYMVSTRFLYCEEWTLQWIVDTQINWKVLEENVCTSRELRMRMMIKYRFEYTDLSMIEWMLIAFEWLYYYLIRLPHHCRLFFRHSVVSYVWETKIQKFDLMEKELIIGHLLIHNNRIWCYKTCYHSEKNSIQKQSQNFVRCEIMRVKNH